MATPRQLFKDISDGKFKSAYFFYGTEDYRISEAIKYVTHQFLPDKQQAVNYRKLDGKKTKTVDLINELSTLPMLGEKQVFVITDFQSYKPTEVSKILSLISPSDPTRIVIFSLPSTKQPNKKTAFYKSVSEFAEPVEFKKLTAQESQSQISHKLKKASLTISNDALTLLVEMIAGNRGALEGELNKLINYKNSDEEISSDDIINVCNGYEMFKVFDLADYIIDGNTSHVLKMIRSLLAEGTTPATLTTLLQQHFCSLYLVKNNKKPIGNRSFLIYKFKPQAAKYSNVQLEDIIVDIAQTDADLRQFGMSPEMRLESLAVSLTGSNIN
jgi:DNA polymerase III delta subunit